MKVRRINLEEDYPTLALWWRKRGSEPPARVLLPDLGVVATLDDCMVACAFLYTDIGRKIAMVEWEATNPTAAPRAVLEGINTVFDFWERYCQEHAIAGLLSWVRTESGNQRLLARRKWEQCPGDRHELMAFVPQKKEAPCPR